MNGDIRIGVGGNDHIRHLPVAARSLGRKAHRHHRPHGGRVAIRAWPLAHGEAGGLERQSASERVVRSDVEALVGAEEQSAAVLIDGAPLVRTTKYAVMGVEA